MQELQVAPYLYIVLSTMTPSPPSLRERFFSSPWDRFAYQGYKKLFSLHEIESSAVLQIALGALLLSLFVGLSRWFYTDSLSISTYANNAHMCWAYFQDCGRFYFLEVLPLGYSQSILFMAIFGIMVAAAYLMYRKEWVFAHALVGLVWLFKVTILFVLTEQLTANYDYYDTLLLFVILFLPHKLFFARLAFVMFYFLSSTIKIHEGWILGSYFTTLATGLPLFGSVLAPIVTNAVIGMQMVGSWFLLSRNAWLRLIALTYFITFHLYSGILVGYRYPTVALVMLLVLFTIRFKETYSTVALDRRSIAGWCFIALLFGMQTLPLTIPGDQKLTLEGNYYGFFMFDANHQCVSRSVTEYSNGTTRERVRESMDAQSRCDAYEYWFTLKNTCSRDTTITRIAWTFDHSINGNPFYRIVDTANVCELEYKPFEHNEWIRVPEDGAAIVGYPLKNYYLR